MPSAAGPLVMLTGRPEARAGTRAGSSGSPREGHPPAPPGGGRTEKPSPARSVGNSWATRPAETGRDEAVPNESERRILTRFLRPREMTRDDEGDFTAGCLRNIGVT